MDLACARTLLFIPGNRPDRFRKGAETQADGVILDLEDAVGLHEKDKARTAVIQSLLEGFPRPSRPFIVAVRLNGLHTREGLQDVIAFIEARVFPDVFVFPKVESPDVLRLYDSYFTFPECEPLQYLGFIESARGLEQAHRIAQATSRLTALALGGMDLSVDLRAKLSWEALLFARSRLVQAACTAELAVFDVPFLDVQNVVGLQEEAKRVSDLGYTGKLAIHPTQVSILMETFAPSLQEIQEAEGIVLAYETAKGNAVQFQGKMIDIPVYHRALQVLKRRRF